MAISMDDLIRRGDVLESLQNCIFPALTISPKSLEDLENFTRNCKTCVLGTVLNVPTAINKDWISCDVELPKSGDKVWISDDYYDEVMLAKLSESRDYWTDVDGDWMEDMEHVSAWMPYFPPYKE